MKLIKQIANFFGYDLYRVKIKDNHLVIDRHVFNLFKILNVNCVIDVGAHKGEFGRRLRRNGFLGQIISFEPVQHSFKELSLCCKNDPKWKAYNFALGSEESTKTIKVMKSDDFSSFLTPVSYSKERFKDSLDIDHAENVQVKTIDSILFKILKDINKPCVFLKMDTQGFDLEVIKGAQKSINNIFGIQSELSFKQIYKDAPDYIHVLKKYNELGFRVSGLYPVSRDKRNLVIIEYDCVMVKELT
ncbi:MAG: FkbM family methyltransferase [Candidatus Omnitrophica bacterium]|nr:FkbM family methyltransferase [Candidatus Omnitrophota bacterium]